MSACNLAQLQAQVGNDFHVYPESLLVLNKTCVGLVRNSYGKWLFLSSRLPGFLGKPHRGGLLCPLSPENAQALLRIFPHLKPRRLADGPSFGFGDRLGLATPGHIRAILKAQVFPVLAQQSVRENNRTGRTFAQVLADAVFGALQEGYTEGFAADADHLKSLEQASEAARLGYTFFTCDPSDLLVSVEKLSFREIAGKGKELPFSQLKKLYLGRSFRVPLLGELRFKEDELLRVSVKYWWALDFAERMFHTLLHEVPDGFDFELSVDEASAATTVLEHLFLALECKRRGIKLVSLAPRFSGTMEKAVDFRGDLDVFRSELQAHMAIAQAFGPYKISLHSGSDKFSLYPILAKEARGLWHVKTAGTSYLVALEVLARAQPKLFREILHLAKNSFPEERKSYQLSAEAGMVPEPESLQDEKLPELFSDSNVRQVLHVTYGAVLRKMGDDLRAALLTYEEEYLSALEKHFRRHLEALGVMESERA